MKKISEYDNSAVRNDSFMIGEQKQAYVRDIEDSILEFNERLRDIEVRCMNSNIKEEAVMSEIAKAFDVMALACQGFEEGVNDKDFIRQVRVKFRELTNDILSKSYCYNRARTWPQGYQGDYKTLETAYRSVPLSEGLGYYLDKHFFNATVAVAVKNRLRMLEEILRDEIFKRMNPKVLNIACGSCRELMSLVPEIQNSNAKLTCIDMDNDSLSFAQSRLSYTGILPQIKFYKYNALRLFDYETAETELGRQDIIYSVGFYDYLETEFLTKLFESLYKLLNENGCMIISFKDADKYRSQDYHWFVDWEGFLQRNPDDFKKIMRNAGIPESKVAETRESSGVIVFYIAGK